VPTSTAYLYPNEVTVDSGAFALTGAPSKPEAIDDPQGLPDDDASYLECSTTTFGVEQIEFGFQSMPEAVSIISVTVELRSKKTSGSGDHQPFINGGSLAGHILDTIYTDYADVFAEDPLTSLPWSKAGVDTAKVTVVQSATVMTARLTGLRLKVVFIASSAKIGAAREVGSRILRAFRRPVGLLNIRGPLLWADVELLTDFSFSHLAYPHAQGQGAGMKNWQRALLRCISTSIDLDTLSVSITGLDLRQFLVNFWDTAISEEPANATAPGAARLDAGAGRLFTRGSKAWVENAAVAPYGSVQIIEIGADIEKAETLGLLIEEARENKILNSAFQLGTFTDWSITGNVEADLADLLFEATVSPQTVALRRLGSGNSRISQGSLSYAGSEVLCLSFWHRDDSAQAPTWTLQRSTDSFYWDDTGETWGAGATSNAPPVASVWTKDRSKPIVLSAGAQDLTLTLYGESIADQLTHLGFAQLEEGAYPTSAIVTEGAPVTREADVLSIDANLVAVWWPRQGTAGVTFIPEWDSSDTSLEDAVLLDMIDPGDSDRFERIIYRPSSGEASYERRIGGVTYSATLAVALTHGVSYRFVGRATGINAELDLAPYTLSIFVNGVRGTDDVADGEGIGEDVFIGSQQGSFRWAGGNLSHISMIPFVLADEEIADWL
jgi:hypothetical protein